MSLSIGQVARASGLSHDTLRYYEREGLVPIPERDTGGRRRYPDRVLDLLGLVATLRAAGFSLAQVRSVLGAKVPGASARERVAAVRVELAELSRELDERQVALDGARAVLAGLAAELDAGEPWPDDPLTC